MAKKEAPESTGTAVETLEQQLARQLAAQALAAQGMRTSGSYISFKNAILKVDGQPVPNNTADVRVLAVVGERAWYDGEFDADVVQVPACYALDSGEPHELSSPPNPTLAHPARKTSGEALNVVAARPVVKALV